MASPKRARAAGLAVAASGAAVAVAALLPGPWRGHGALMATLGVGAAVLGLSASSAARHGGPALGMVAALAGLASAARVPFVTLPGVQPVTLLVLAAGWALGPSLGLLTGTLAALVSNTLLGHGPHTVWMAAGWGLVGVAGGGLGRLFPDPPAWLLATVAALVAFPYGALTDVSALLFLPSTSRSFATVYLMGLPFDLAHAVGNAVFASVAGRELVSVLRRTGSRLLRSTPPARGMRKGCPRGSFRPPTGHGVRGRTVPLTGSG